MRLLRPFGPEAFPTFNVWRVDSTSSGVRIISPNSEPRFGPVLLRTLNLPGFVGSEKGTELSPNSEPAEPGFGPVLTLNSESARVRSLEKGTWLSPNSEPAKLRFCIVLSLNSELFGERNWTFSEIRTCRTRVQPSSYPELRICQGSEFGERNWPFSELRTCRTRVIPVLSLNSEPAQPALYPFFLRTPNWNSKLRAKTQSWTILWHSDAMGHQYMYKSQALRPSTSLGQIVIYLLSTAATAFISVTFCTSHLYPMLPTYGDNNFHYQEPWYKPRPVGTSWW